MVAHTLAVLKAVSVDSFYVNLERTLCFFCWNYTSHNGDKSEKSLQEYVCVDLFHPFIYSRCCNPLNCSKSGASQSDKRRRTRRSNIRFRNLPSLKALCPPKPWIALPPATTIKNLGRRVNRIKANRLLKCRLIP